jgi:6-phosphogluconolactonase
LYGYEFDQNNGTLATLPGMPLTTGAATGSIVVSHEYKYLYTTNFSANNVDSFSINPATGTVTPITTTAVGTSPGYLCTDSQSRYLYVSNGATASINGFSITESTGAITGLPSSPYATASQNLGIGVAPRDNYLSSPMKRPTVSGVFLLRRPVLSAPLPIPRRLAQRREA